MVDIPLLVIAVFLLIVVVRLVILEKKFAKVFATKGEPGIGTIIAEQKKSLDELWHDHKELAGEVSHAQQMLLKSVQKVGIVRFKSFQDSGGDQSFAIVLLDGERNGFALSGLHAQGRVLVYAKPIEGGISKHQLTVEEEDALKTALS